MDNPGVERVIGEAVPAASRPSIPARVYGLGSVFGKTLRDSTPAMLGVGLLLGLVVLVTMVAIGDQFDTLEERLALARQMELLPDFFQGLLGPAVALDTLPGFLSWRLVGILPLMIGLWSVTALGATLASEASRGTLEMVLATPLRRRSLAVQKFLGHAVALALALALISVVAWLSSIAFAKLPGDEMSLVTALSEFAMVGAIALFAGALAFMASVLFGRTVGIGIGGGYLFAAFAVNGYAGLVPGFDLLRLGSVFYWTQGHRPMAGSSDWPAVAFVFVLAAVFAAAGVALFVRRDLNSPISISTRLRRGGAGAGSGRRHRPRPRPTVGWSLESGRTRRAIGRRPAARGGWLGSGNGHVRAVRGLRRRLVRAGHQLGAPDRGDGEHVLSELRLRIGRRNPPVRDLRVHRAPRRAGRGFVGPRLDVGRARRPPRDGPVDADPPRRLVPAQRRRPVPRGAVDGPADRPRAGHRRGRTRAMRGRRCSPAASCSGLYGAALVGVGLAVGGAGWPNLAALAVGAFTIVFYLLDLLGGLLGLPDELLNLSLTRHLGQPMVGEYDWPGMIACLALAVGGLLFGAWRFSRRDLRGI